MEAPLISVVVPCYNEQETIPKFYSEMKKMKQEHLQEINLEYLFVDDGSADETLDVIRRLAGTDPDVKYISFSRNFGKEAAMYAGLEEAAGDFVCIMDADLQDPPELLPEMYRTLQSGEYDMAAARRINRKGEPPVRSFFARQFYRLMSKISRNELLDGARDYRLMTRQVVDEMLRLQEYHRFTKGMMNWIGFRTRWIPYENVERSAGESKWSFFQLLKYSLEGITAFSTVPLMMSSVLGLLFCLIAVIMILVIVIKTLVWGDPVAGYPSMMCFIFLLSGIQLFSVGIIGQYLAKTYMETKRRPIYIAKERHLGKGTNDDKTE